MQLSAMPCKSMMLTTNSCKSKKRILSYLIYVADSSVEPKRPFSLEEQSAAQEATVHTLARRRVNSSRNEAFPSVSESNRAEGGWRFGRLTDCGTGNSKTGFIGKPVNWSVSDEVID